MNTRKANKLVNLYEDQINWLENLAIFYDIPFAKAVRKIIDAGMLDTYEKLNLSFSKGLLTNSENLIFSPEDSRIRREKERSMSSAVCLPLGENFSGDREPRQDNRQTADDISPEKRPPKKAFNSRSEFLKEYEILFDENLDSFYLEKNPQNRLHTFFEDSKMVKEAYVKFLIDCPWNSLIHILDVIEEKAKTLTPVKSPSGYFFRTATMDSYTRSPEALPRYRETIFKALKAKPPETPWTLIGNEYFQGVLKDPSHVRNTNLPPVLDKVAGALFWSQEQVEEEMRKMKSNA